MKINKILLGLAVAMLGVMTSCNTDVEGVTYSPMGQNVSFETSAPSTVTTAETSIVIPVRIVRSVVANEYTANFTTKASEEGIFTNDANGAVKFEAGQGVAIINVKADNLAKGVDYTYTLKLSEAEVAGRDTITNTQNDSIVIKIHSDYNWISGGSCTFVDYTFSENGQAAKDVPIQHAEGTNVYCMIGLFQSGYDINFTIESDNRVYVSSQPSEGEPANEAAKGACILILITVGTLSAAVIFAQKVSCTGAAWWSTVRMVRTVRMTAWYAWSARSA